MDRLGIVRRRLYAQRLAGGVFETAAEAVGRLGAMQSQEFAEALWSLGERLSGHTEAAVEDAFARGEILRTHVLRPTWHFVAATDLRWLLSLSGPRVQRLNAGRYRELGLDGAQLAASQDVLAGALRDGAALTRRELAGSLDRAGVDTGGQRLAYMVMHAELEQVICSGPRRGRRHTYMLLDYRAPAGPRLTRGAALAELARRYFTSHGPATRKDFCWWSGLTAADAGEGIEAIRAELEAWHDDEGREWLAAPAGRRGRATGAFLVPKYDELTVAYKDVRMVGPDQRPNDDLMSRPIVVDGAAVGRWSRSLSAREAVVEATLPEPTDTRSQQAIEDAADRFGAFVGLPATLRTVAAQ